MALPSSSKRPHGELLDDDKRRRVLSELAAAGVSRTGLSKTLKGLHERGLLTDPLSNDTSLKGYRREVNRAFELNAMEDTPFGPILCESELPTDELQQNERTPRRRCMWYLSPFALLFTICSVSHEFFLLVRAARGPDGVSPLSIILYLDGINPGNPLAPDPQLLLQAVYWTFKELPNYFLRRKDAWFVFSLVREVWANKLPGKLSELAKIILLIFFPPSGESFQKGVIISHGDQAIVVRATFCGFLADEKCLKQLFEITGQAGSVLCIDCLNVRNRWCRLKEGEQHYWDPAIENRKQATKTHIEIMIRRVSEAQGAQRARLQTSTGIKFCPTGLLFCSYLMSFILNPCKNYVRDWMHTLVSNGVAGTHLACICQALDAAGIPLNIVQAYSHKFVLPRSRGGKPSNLYFKDALMATDHVRHFASDVLGMVTILYCFLVEKVRPRNMLDERNITCFVYLYQILCILRRGDIDEAISATLHDVILKHNTLFLELYGNRVVKIKFHHMYHLARDMLYLLGCLSCFPTERKNKEAIAVSTATDCTVERTSVIAFLQRTLNHWKCHIHTCSEMYLHDEKVTHVQGLKMSFARAGTFKCGDLHAQDVAYFQDDILGTVLSFWKFDGRIFITINRHRRVPNTMQWDLAANDVQFIDAELLIEPVFWYAKATSIFVAVPSYGE